MKKFSRSFFAASLTLCAFASSQAEASDVHSPRTAGLGGAGRAGPLLNDAIVLNPSFVSFLPTYSIALNYLSFKGAQVPGPAGPVDPHGRNYSVSIQDGRSDLFQAGVTYTQMEGASVLNVGASRSIVKRVGFGLGGKFVFDKSRNLGAQDMILSFTGVPSDSFQTAFIVDNLLETQKGVAQGLYREFAIGMKFNVMGILLFYLDPHYAPSLPSDQSFGHEMGVELSLLSDLFIRAGQFRNSKIPFTQQRGQGFATGVGWISPRLSLDYALERALTPTHQTAHIFGATLYF